jgi:hypothetical protein
MFVQRWFSKPTTNRVSPEPARKRRLALIGAVALLGVIGGLGWWRMVPAPAPVVELPQTTRTEPVVVVVEPPAPIPVHPVESVTAPVPAPEPVLVDPFQAYQQIAGDSAAPAGAGTVRVDRLPVPPPPAPMPMPTFTPPVPPTPAAPAPSRPPAPPTLAEWVRTAGWSVEAIGVGAQTSVLLRVGEHSGFYRVGETVENSIRIVRIDPDRVVLARGAERAVLEVQR